MLRHQKIVRFWKKTSKMRQTEQNRESSGINRTDNAEKEEDIVFSV